MMIHFTLNGTPREIDCVAGENVQKLLFGLGLHSVRNSDDGFGFAGSDAIWCNGIIVNASLLIAGQLEGGEIKTAESLGSWNQLSLVQQAMVDTGVVQSGYNDPAAALILTDLLQRIASPTREDIDDALSGLFSRDAGYQQFYQVVDLAKTRLTDPTYQPTVTPTFRHDLAVTVLCRRPRSCGCLCGEDVTQPAPARADYPSGCQQSGSLARRGSCDHA